MPRRLWISLAAALAIAAFVPALTSAAGQAQGNKTNKKFVAPHLPWGDPDVQGNFTTKDEANTPLERPDEFAGRRIEDITPQELASAVRARQHNAVASAPYAGGGSRARGVALGVPIHWLDHLDAGNARPWFIVDPPDGKIPPLTADAQQRAAAAAKAREGRGTADSYTDRSLYDRCINYRGPAVGTMFPGIYGNSFQIIQTKDYVAIRYEMVHETQVIPIEGRGASRPHKSTNFRSYFGDAVARFEGNTLVVDTTNYHALVNYRGAGPNLHTVERFTRTGPNKVEWTATVEDSTTWPRPWTFSIPLTEDDGQPIFEYACHEGNLGLRNILSAGRSDDRKGIKSSNNADNQGDLKGEFDE